MKNIRFQKIMLLSYLERKARIIDLNSDFVLIKGTNHVGKSCVLKSLYRALGAEIKKMPDTWDMSTVILLLFFTIDNIPFRSLLIGNDLYLLNPDDSIRFKEKIGSKVLSKEINALLGVDIGMVDDSQQIIPVGANFMPFYIDQDSGWSETWASFSKVGTLSDKSNVRQYLTGIVDISFFTHKKQLAATERKLKKCISDLRAYKLLSEQIKVKLNPLNIELDVEKFKKRTEQYLTKLKDLRESQNKHLSLMQELYAKKAYIELNIEQLKRNIKEIEKDFQYALYLEDVVICPTCGGHYANDIVNRHELMKDEHVCKDMVIRSNNDLDIVNKQIEAAVEKSKDISSAIESTQDLIKGNNGEISLEEVIEAKSREQMLDLVSKQQAELMLLSEKLLKEKNELESIIKNYGDTGRKEEAGSLFVDYVMAAIDSMGAQAARGKIRFGSRITATGSALPVNIIAHTFSYLKLMQKFSGPLFMPVVIDEPRQQGLLQQGLNMSLSYMLQSMPNNGQLIVSLAEDTEFSIPENAIIINLDMTGRVLIDEDFETVAHEIDKILEIDFQRIWN